MKKRRIDASENYQKSNSLTPLVLESSSLSDGLIGCLCCELVLTILSYCDASDVFIIRQCSPLLRKSSKDLLLHSNALYLSVLGKHPVKKKKQTSVVKYSDNTTASSGGDLNEQTNHTTTRSLYLNRYKQEEYISRIFQETLLKNTNKDNDHDSNNNTTNIFHVGHTVA